MAGFQQFLTIFFKEFINIGTVYIRGWVGGAQGLGGWWQKLNQSIKKTQIVESNFPLQSLDRRVLTMGAISGPHSQLGALL